MFFYFKTLAQTLQIQAKVQNSSANSFSIFTNKFSIKIKMNKILYKTYKRSVINWNFCFQQKETSNMWKFNINNSKGFNKRWWHWGSKTNAWKKCWKRRNRKKEKKFRQNNKKTTMNKTWKFPLICSMTKIAKFNWTK